MLRRIYTSTPSSLRRASKTVRSLPKLQRRSLIPAPTQRSGPLLERRADRELPPLPPSAASRWLKTLPLFVTAIGLSALAIFNYQKTSSSVVNSTLYSLRTNPEARAILGDEIYFRDRFPWIWGELNQLHGKIDIGFWVKGNNGSGYMRFRSVRRARMGYVRCNLSTECEKSLTFT